MRTILLISPYWKESHRWMVSTVKLAELWQRLGYRVVVACMGNPSERGVLLPTGEGGAAAPDEGQKTEGEGRANPTEASAEVGERGERAKETLSHSLTIYRKKDLFLPDPWNYGIALGFTGFVRRIIKDEKPDIVVVNKILFWSSLCVIALRLTGQKVILLSDALVGMTWWGRGLPFRIASRIYAWTLGWLIMVCAEKIVFFHPQPEKLLKTLGVAGKAEVIPTGIDPIPYHRPSAHPPIPQSTEQKEMGKWANGHLTITYVGRLESVKGVDDFLAAATSMNTANLKIQVIGWYKDGHPLVKEYENRVTFTGLRSDIPEILKTTDIFVLPSYSEGLSNALMEAMASGCACVASDVGGNAYLIQNGISGFLFPAGDREALTAHLRRLIDDPAKRSAMGAAARKRIEEWFSWDIVGKRYIDLFEIP